MNIYDLQLTKLDGTPLDLRELRGRATLIVNVASKCGLTPQYRGLQALCERFGERGFGVVGVPCNQFGGQEPGSAEEIAACSASYEVSFPLTEKLEVNGPRRHPLYHALASVADDTGYTGDIRWNFEKFLVSPAGEAIARFQPLLEPGSAQIVSAVESSLPTGAAPVWAPRPAGEVSPGDRVRLPDGTGLVVTRVESPFLGRDDLVCLIEDTSVRWLAHSMSVGSTVDVLTS